MKLHIITIGQPKLAYAKSGWEEYRRRLEHYHQLRVTHIADKHNDAAHILQIAQGSYTVAMVIEGPQLTSSQLAAFLADQTLQAREVSFLVGGPDGLPAEVIKQADSRMGLSKLTFPHDLAMVILLETLYRSSTINAGQPYHR